MIPHGLGVTYGMLSRPWDSKVADNPKNIYIEIKGRCDWKAYPSLFVVQIREFLPHVFENWSLTPA